MERKTLLPINWIVICRLNIRLVWNTRIFYITETIGKFWVADHTTSHIVPSGTDIGKWQHFYAYLKSHNSVNIIQPESADKQLLLVENISQKITLYFSQCSLVNRRATNSGIDRRTEGRGDIELRERRMLNLNVNVFQKIVRNLMVISYKNIIMFFSMYQV